MLGSEGVLPDRQRALVERLGLHIPTPAAIKPRQIVEALANVGLNGETGTNLGAR
jgi:hypothetical protein